MINRKYYIRPEDLPKIAAELGLIDGNKAVAFSLWEQQYGSNSEEYQTQTQFRTTFVDGLTDSDKPYYLDPENNPVDSTSDNAQTTEAGLSSMKNYLDEQVSMIVNGTETGIDKTNKLLKLQEKLTTALEEMQKNIQENITDPDSDKEYELVLNMVAQLDRIINNQIEVLNPEVEIEKQENQQTANNSETFKYFNENIASLIEKTKNKMSYKTDAKYFDEQLRKMLKSYNKENGTTVTLEALKTSLESSGLYPEFNSSGNFKKD
jgi:hypothetical protein